MADQGAGWRPLAGDLAGAFLPRLGPRRPGPAAPDQRRL